MFDIGFSELLLFGVIALVVLGPEKLPHAARTAGKWYAKIRRTVSTLQSEIEAELDLAETRQKMQEELEKIKQAEAEMKREMAELKGSMKEFENAQNQSLTSLEPEASTTSKPNDNRYAYGAHLNKLDSSDTSTSIASKTKSLTDTSSEISGMSTKPWVGMWFLLGDYDRTRRLPPPPFKPNYQATRLLNTAIDTPVEVNRTINNDISKPTSAYSPAAKKAMSTNAEHTSTQAKSTASTEVQL